MPTVDSAPSLPPLLSVIILNYNGEPFLRPCLDSLRAQTLPGVEVIVVDNASPDGSAEIVAREYPEVKLLRLAENRHFCGGNNAGLPLATGRYVAFLNNDTRVVPEWAEEIVRAFGEHPEVGTVACRIVLADQPELLNSAGVEWTSGFFGRQIGALQSAADYAEERLVFGFEGGGCALRREVLDQVGSFDEDFQSHHEDQDLSFRVLLGGWKCLYAPGATVLHHVSATYGQVRPLVVHRTTRNAEWVVLKNVPWPMLLKHGLEMEIHRLYGLMYWSLHGGFWARVGGHVAAWGKLGKMLRKRREIQRSARVGWREIEAYTTVKCLPEALLGTKWPRVLRMLEWPGRCWRRLFHEASPPAPSPGRRGGKER
jgi:GT2 family glycosyltransferase